MRSIGFFVLFLLLRDIGHSQYYFNSIFRDSTHLTEPTTNVIVLEDDGFLLSNPYVPQDSSVAWMGLNVKKISASGEFVSTHNILPEELGIVFANYAESFIELEDGYVQCTKYNDTAVVIKINHLFGLEWMTGVPGISSFERCITLSDNRLLCVGNTHPPGVIHLYWLAQDGTILSEKHITPFADSDFYQTGRVIELSNGDLLFSGVYLVGADANHMMFRLHSAGDEIWKKTWDYEYRDEFIWALVESEQEAIAAFGHVDTVYNPNSSDHSWYDSRIGTMRVDLASGDTSDVILYPGAKTGLFLTDFVRNATGGYAILGFYHNPDNPMPYSSLILNLNENRDPLWIKDYSHLPIEESDQQWSQAYDIDLTPDSGFVVAGTWMDPLIDNRQAPWLFKIDGCGDLVWNNCTLAGMQEQVSLQPQVYAFPNPAEDVIRIGSKQVLKQMIWYDMTGKICMPEVMSQNTFESVFSTTALQAGIYAVQLKFEDGTGYTLRVVVH